MASRVLSRAFAGLLLVINVDVIGRTVFTAPLPGVAELVKLSIIAIVFLQIGHTLRSGRITRVDSVLESLRRKRPRVAAALECAYSLIGAVFFVILLWACTPLFWRAWQRGEY